MPLVALLYARGAMGGPYSVGVPMPGNGTTAGTKRPIAPDPDAKFTHSVIISTSTKRARDQRQMSELPAESNQPLLPCSSHVLW